MASQYDILSRAADAIASRLGRAPVGVVLGSGLSEALDSVAQPRFVEYAHIPGMPQPSAAGHRGALLHGYVGDVAVLALCGRIHVYEGRRPDELAMPVRLLSLLGVHSLVVTSAVGSANPEVAPGNTVLIEDHINLSGHNVLSGEWEPRLGPRFPDMTRAYDPELIGIFEEAARLTGVPVARGVLAQFLGPSYETPAEVAVARSMGAHVVSMSMVPDVLVARQRGMRVAGLGCVTHQAAGCGGPPVDHGEVLAASARNAEHVQALLAGAVGRLAERKELSRSRPRSGGAG